MKQFNKRWFDKDLGCQTLVDQIKEIRQPEVRDFCAQLVLQFSDRIGALVRKQSDEHLEMGLTGLQGLYLAKKERRRWYDQEPIVQKALNSLYTLSEDSLKILSSQLINTISVLSLYSFIFNLVEQPPVKDHMMQLTKISTGQGKDAAEAFLSEIVGKDLYTSMLAEFSKKS